ncbi:DNA internalization-related competence protein ComEC/Rec2 [Halopseudomonas sp.]|jgi:competence protein ComEC|uniref:DNA internalization-related competence protein ComEC/Rec2 n=1 Tax=Halopseudomonas sp. TaxID=2901191 RepID=UPI0039E4BC30
MWTNYAWNVRATLLPGGNGGALEVGFFSTLVSRLLVLWLGLLLPLTLESLPSLPWLFCLTCLIPIAGLWRPAGRHIGLLLAGVVWACLFHHQQLEQRLHSALDMQRVVLEGRVQGLPEATDIGWRFRIADARLQDSPQGVGQALPSIRAHWYAGEQVFPGEYWRFEARLRRPRGMSNPGRFDYEAWLYANGVGAVASISSGEHMQRPNTSGLGPVRDYIRQRLQKVLVESPGHSRLTALVVGDRSVLDKADWDVLQATGTSHLMVISGLHVGMFAAAIFGLAALAGRMGLLPFTWPRLWLAAPLAVLAAALYAGLAGFAVPTQRALLMVALVLLAKLIYRQPGPWLFWSAALCSVTLLNPAAPLLAGFWLSFMAVGLLILGMHGRLQTKGLWWRWGRAQWVVFIGLWPWLLLWGMPGSIISPLVNVLAIPWVSLIVVPAALLGTVLELVFGTTWLLIGAGKALAGLFAMLSWAAQWHLPSYLAFPGWFNWSLGTVAALALLSPLARLLCVPALVCLPVLLSNPQARPQERQLWVTVLDVGQGLAVLLQTREHNLLYDAGARLSSGFDLGEAVVHPALVELGVARLDRMLISHADNDHAGGAMAMFTRMPVIEVLAGQHEALPAALPVRPCEAGESWQWNGISFAVIYSAPPPAPANERSCVLRAGIGAASVLLPGDLGIRGEYQMLRETLTAQLLLAPHHGSRTSSSYTFIRAVDPRWAVFSAGAGNAFNHPHPKVVDRYRELGVEPVYTSASGAIRFVLDEAGGSYRKWSWRDEARRFWHE